MMDVTWYHIPLSQKSAWNVWSKMCELSMASLPLWGAFWGDITKFAWEKGDRTRHENRDRSAILPDVHRDRSATADGENDPFPSGEISLNRRKHQLLPRLASTKSLKKKSFILAPAMKSSLKRKTIPFLNLCSGILYIHIDSRKWILH